MSRQYVVKISDYLRFVYCDLTLECGGKKGWMRIANINITDGSRCPNEWKKITSPTKACKAPRSMMLDAKQTEFICMYSTT